ncbi:TIGR03032 family protein [Dapis sp. BLCC M172]|uniref:TIGR03032 family protein n=1 Tax=Dapis sp. BLCC M172 TaxID=2975281 RepID=UPI003CF103C8
MPEKASFEIFGSQQFIDWLNTEKLSLAFTTYQSNRLFFIGIKPDGSLSATMRTFDRPMGLYATADSLTLATRYQVWQLENMVEKGRLFKDRDKMYVPRRSWMTGQLDIHDIVQAQWGDYYTQKVIFVNTLFDCLATLSDRYSFTPLWKPAFISKLAPEERCHLNGLAIVEGKPAYVTACGQSDVVDGWRDQRRNGGCVIDVSSKEIIATELSMPHSPRFYQDKLWLLNSGKGEFGYLDFQTGKFQPVKFCGGYLRGMTFWKNYAIVGLSRPRKREQTFSGLVLQERLAAKGARAFCGLQVINLDTGDILHWLRIEGIIVELYDVAVLPGVRYPGCIGWQETDELRRVATRDLSIEI